MEESDWISLGAMIIAMVSLGLSCYTIFLDRPRVKTSCSIVNRRKENGSMEPELVCGIRNHGKRPIILLHFGWKSNRGEACETIRPKSIRWKQGDPQVPEDWEQDAPRPEVRLGENDSFEKQLPKDSFYGVDGPSRLCGTQQLFFEDATGRRYYITRSQKVIQEYRNSKKN